MNDILCKRCGQYLPSSEFKADQRYKRGFTSWCNDCHRERKREWAKENKKRLAAKAAEWRKANPEKAKQTWQGFHNRNKVKRAAAHAEWAFRNKDKRRATSARRKAAKLQATPAWVNWKAVNAIYKNAKKMQEFTGIPMHVDHIVPLQGANVCGLHWEGNLQVIPASENCAKFNKWDDQMQKAYAQPDLFVEPPKPAKQEAFDV